MKWNLTKIVPCIKNLIGDKIYDAITLDLFDYLNENVIELTQRLRDRFLEAIFINIRQQFLGNIGFKCHKEWANVARQAKAMGQDSITEEARDLFDDSNRLQTLKQHDYKMKFYE